MPIDHYKMSIQAKPLYSVLGKTDVGSLMKIVRPLGSIRRAKVANFSSDRNEIPQKSLDISTDNGFVHQDKPTNTSPLDDPDTRQEDISAEHQEDSDSAREDQFLPKMQRTRSKVFESRYKIAASRNSEPVKPAKLYNKRVVYLPMFRINVETYVGNDEDNRAVENTRQSLKMMIDKGRRQAKSTSRVKSASIKSYNFVTPGRENEVPLLDTATPRPLIQTNHSFLSTPRMSRNVPVIMDCHTCNSAQEQRRHSEVNSDDTDRMDVHFETLDLNSSIEESLIDQVEAENRSEISRVAPSETRTTITTLHRRKSRGYGSLSDPYRHTGPPGQQDQMKIGWPSYEDFRRMKQKGRNHILSKKQSKDNKKSTNDVQKWVNIHYTKSKPLQRYTPPPSFPKLTPIIVPSHTCEDCPMCELACQTERGPTPCPPNSPTFGITKSSYIQSPHRHCHSDSKIPPKDHVTSKSVQINRNEMTIPKVTVKVLDTKQQLEEAKLSYSKFPN